MLWQRRPVAEATADPALPVRTRALLDLVDEVRRSAAALGLAVDGQYTSYVDWPGDRVVTTLVRTRAGTLETEPWWFPLVGRLPYKGYFDRARAEAEAERIRREGAYDVCVSGVAAYSTLGWLDDPVTGPMLRRGPAHLVETIFHELVHATAFVSDEADWNEGVAQFIGQQAAILFFEQHARSPSEVFDVAAEAELLRWPSADRVRAIIADRTLVAEAMLAFKERVEGFAGHPERAMRRAVAEREARARLAALPLRVLDPARIADRARLSDACLALRGAYVGDAARHAAVLAALGGRLPAMIDRLKTWAEAERPVEDFFDVTNALPAVAAD